MNKTVVGVFKDFAEAQLVVQELLKVGVMRHDISIVAHAETTDLATGTADLKRLTLPDGMPVMASGMLGDAMTSPGADSELAKFGISTKVSSAYRESIRGGKVLVAVQTTEDQVGIISDLMNRYCTTDLKQDSHPNGQTEVTVPIVQEELQVGKREIQRGGVHVVSRVTELPVQESVRLREEHVTVERHPVDRPLAPGESTAFKESTFEVRQHAEVAVVSKEARVVEEVVISKTVTEHTETVRDTVRRTNVVVEDLPAKGNGDRYASHEAEFRTNYSGSFATSGYSYDEVAPAYRFGMSLNEVEQYRGKDWNTVADVARSNWEMHHPGSWERFKDAIRYAWERVQAAVN